MSESEPRQALNALVARLRATPRARRPELIRHLLPLIASSRLPIPVRIAAAAQILRFIPDRLPPVRRITRALTVGLSPQRSLDRLRQLQHQVDKCNTLDELIEIREQRLQLTCPRCRIRLPRIEMIKHLWHKHRLTLDSGKTHTLRRAISKLKSQHVATGDTDPLDRVAGIAGAAGLRRWLADDDTSAEELAPLLHEAAERGVGLCPACFAYLPATIQTIPPPLVLSKGRLAGDGFAVAVREKRWFRTLTLTTPDRKLSVGRRSLTPRGVGILVAALALFLTLAFAPSIPFAIAGSLIALCAYIAIRLNQTSPDSRDDRIIDVAWLRIVPTQAEKKAATRILTRMCLSSLGRGDPIIRAGMLNQIIARAQKKCGTDDEELQLLAAASVVHVEDEAQFGRDVVAGIAALAADAFMGILPSVYAEYVVACYLTHERDPGNLARLRILLIAAAFQAGLVPRDLFDLWAGAPNLKRAMAMEPAHRLGLLFGVWRTREAQAWKSVSPATTVFDLARTSPPTAARVLAEFPDLLLYHRPERHVEDIVGPLLICCRGVAVAGQLTADPDAEVELAVNGRELVFGRHRIELNFKLSAEFVELIRRWLRFRVEAVVPYIDGYLSHGSGESSSRVLRPFCRKCSSCGTLSVVSVGAVGREMPS
jgi:hypothetical protein